MQAQLCLTASQPVFFPPSQLPVQSLQSDKGAVERQPVISLGGPQAIRKGYTVTRPPSRAHEARGRGNTAGTGQWPLKVRLCPDSQRAPLCLCDTWAPITMPVVGGIPGWRTQRFFLQPGSGSQACCGHARCQGTLAQTPGRRLDVANCPSTVQTPRLQALKLGGWGRSVSWGGSLMIPAAFHARPL